MTSTTTTLASLVATFNSLAVAAGVPTRKSFDSKAKAEAAIAALKPANVKIRKAGAVRNAGPRGFKMGPVWLASIVNGSGAALLTANLPKLKETADTFGVDVTPDLTQAEIAELVAKALV